MSKAPLKDVQENIANIRPCPACTHTPGLADCMANQMGQAPNGRRRRRHRGLYRSAMPVCDFCKGLRVVCLNRICECGYPAIIWDEDKNVWSCGLKACIASALWRKEHPFPKIAQEYYTQDMFGGG